MLDVDLAAIYGIETRVLNQSVLRNISRFPSDFMFHLTRDEIRNISQIVICSSGYTGIKHAKRVTAFTEHGAVMLAAVLNSPQAVQASVAIARAFVRMRRSAFGRRELAARLRELEGRVGGHDKDIRGLFDALDALNEGGDGKGKKIGFSP